MEKVIWVWRTGLGKSDQTNFAVLKIRPIPGHIWGADFEKGISFALSHWVLEIWHSLVSEWFFGEKSILPLNVVIYTWKICR